MLDAIREIGLYAIKEEGKSIDDPLAILVKSPANNATRNVMFIVIDRNGEDFVYRGIDIEEYSSDNILRYCYKKGSPHGTDLTPTSMITNVESTFEKVKILPWFKNQKDEFLRKIGNCLRENREKIIADLKQSYSRENNIISLKIDGKYVGDYEIFRNILIEKAAKKFYYTPSFSPANRVSRSQNQICSICNQRKDTVFGFVNTFKFYTVDKPGFVSGGFQQRYAWKNFPVCLNCALTLEAGKAYLGKFMNFSFYGFNYLVIPEFLSEVDETTRKDIFKKIERQRNPEFRTVEIRRLTTDENEILDLMSKQKNFLNLNFMFYDVPRGYDGTVFNILLYIEDILPSRLKYLFDKKEEVDSIGIFKECMVPISEKQAKKSGYKPLEFNFGVLRRFVPRVTFLNIVDRIFTGKPVDYDFLMQFIMHEIRAEFINDHPTRVSTLSGFMLLNYLYRLGLITCNDGEGDMKSNEKGGIFEKATSDEQSGIGIRIDSFFREFDEFFGSDAKKAIFLEGVLAQKLLNIQYQERGATPFRAKLKGLNLNEKQIKKLLPEIQNKLEEYGKNYYRTLESVISRYFISAGNDWGLSSDDISFYFVLGMNLSHMFRTDNNDDGGGEARNE